MKHVRSQRNRKRTSKSSRKRSSKRSYRQSRKRKSGRRSRKLDGDKGLSEDKIYTGDIKYAGVNMGEIKRVSFPKKQLAEVIVPMFKQIQVIKELLCWVINFDAKIKFCFIKSLNSSRINSPIIKKLLLDLYDSYTSQINLLFLATKNLKVISPETSDEFCVIGSISSKITDLQIKNDAFDGVFVNKFIKNILSLSNKKLELLIKLYSISENNLVFTNDECSRLGQTSTGQIILILKELVNNGMSNEHIIQKDLGSNINNIMIPKKSWNFGWKKN